MKFFTWSVVFPAAVLAACSAWGQVEFRDRPVAQFGGDAKVAESIDVLHEIMQISSSSIPRALLNDAQAVAIVPRVIKGSFIVGARRGEGVVLVRDSQGNWQAPVFVTLTGGNIGWQIGVQSTDVVLVFKTRTSVEQMLSGTLTIGADAAAAAGPVGRDAAIATDDKLKAEVYSYSRSRGLFAGVSLDGSVLKLDQAKTAAYYHPQGSGQASQIPNSAMQLIQTLKGYMGENVSGLVANASPVTTPNGTATNTTDSAEMLRQQIATAANPLFRILDPSWQSYLALPGEIFAGGQHASEHALNDCIARYDAVIAGTQYQSLADRGEFRTVYELLKQYRSSLGTRSPIVGLPSPPANQQPK